MLKTLMLLKRIKLSSEIAIPFCEESNARVVFIGSVVVDFFELEFCCCSDSLCR
jgi:hypothetical protein